MLKSSSCRRLSTCSEMIRIAHGPTVNTLSTKAGAKSVVACTVHPPSSPFFLCDLLLAFGGMMTYCIVASCLCFSKQLRLAHQIRSDLSVKYTRLGLSMVVEYYADRSCSISDIRNVCTEQKSCLESVHGDWPVPLDA